MSFNQQIQFYIYICKRIKQLKKKHVFQHNGKKPLKTNNKIQMKFNLKLLQDNHLR